MLREKGALLRSSSDSLKPMSSKTADIVIIGGGIIGMSIAYQTARRGSLRVMVLEKGAGLGEGSTGASSAITRQRYTRDEMVELVRDSNRVFRNWSEYTGLAGPRASNHPVGVLWSLGSSKTAVEADAARLQSFNIHASVLSPADLEVRFPQVNPCNHPFSLESEHHQCNEAGYFLLEEDAGYFEATSALEDVAEAARREGVVVSMNSEVVGVRTSGGSVVGVTLADGTQVDGGVVVNAAGPWCNKINALAGVEQPWKLVPTRIAVGHRPVPPELAGTFPAIADPLGGVYFRPEAGGQQVIFGSTLEEDEMESADPDMFSRFAERSFLDAKVQALHHRLPGLPFKGTVAGMCGMYTVNRVDVHPIVGMSELDGFFLVNGFSGHGFKEAPMIGAQCAKFFTGADASFDTKVPIELFAIDRAPLVTENLNVLA